MSERKLDPITPGEILLEEFMKPFNLSQNKLARELDIPPIRINEIVNGKRGITADTALRLAKFFNTSPDLWIGLQTEYDLRIASNKIGAYIDKKIIPLDSGNLTID